MAERGHAVDRSGVAIENRTIPGPAGAPDVPVRIYSPEGLTQTVAWILHIHGGGFVMGNLDSELGSCVGLCRDLGVVVVSVDYRLAPETPYPGPLEDCYAALQWVSGNGAQLKIDPARIAVFGLSAGGGLAAATALLARDRGGPPIRFQLLMYPVTAYDFETASYHQNAEGYLLERADMIYYWRHYLPNEAAAAEPYAAPLGADLRGLPPAHVTMAEFEDANPHTFNGMYNFWCTRG